MRWKELWEVRQAPPGGWPPSAPNIPAVSHLTVRVRGALAALLGAARQPPVGGRLPASASCSSRESFGRLEGP